MIRSVLAGMQRAARLACAVCVACSACQSGSAPPGASDTTSTAPAVDTTAAPADHLAPGELLEGTELALGIPLPRGLKVYGAFSDVVYASGQVELHPLVQYFRARLRDGSVREGEDAAEFEHVKLLSSDAQDLTIEIGPMAPGLRVEIRDTTPKLAPNLPDEAARWKRAGLTPEGRIADPTHLD